MSVGDKMLNQGADAPRSPSFGSVSMTAVLLDGKQLAQTMQAEIAADAAAFTQRSGVRPGLAAVLVGDSPQSQSYVRSKQKACEKAGIASWLHHLPQSTSQADLLALIARLNADPAVHGILVQLPLPPHIDEAAVVDAVSPLKDVDGFGPESLGLLAAGRPRLPGLYALRRAAIARPQRRLAGRRSRRRHRPQQHRRPAFLPYPLSKGRGRHGDALPQPQPRRGRADAQRRHRRGGHRQAALPARRHGTAGRGGRGRGHEPDAGRPLGRRRRLRGALARSSRRSRPFRAASAR